MNTGRVVFAPAVQWSGVKVFTATKVSARLLLGERFTTWLHEHPEFLITEIAVSQSSDSRFHCVTITAFYSPRTSSSASTTGSRTALEDRDCDE